MRNFPEHPEIECCLRTGYPSWQQEGEHEEDEDSLYEERRERELFGE